MPESQNRQSGVESGAASGTSQTTERPLSAREQMLQDLDDQIIRAREQDDEYFLATADPRAVALHAEMTREAQGREISADSRTGREAAEEPIVTQEEETTAPIRDDAGRFASRHQDEGDPLAEFIVREAGKPPMFKALVNGQVRLIPLDQARAQLQKHVSADVTLAQANARRRELDERERRLNEEAARRRAEPVSTPINEAELESEATELVRSLVSEPESVAAKKLAKTLGKIRAAVPHIDVNAVAKVAATEAKREIAEDGYKAALVSGLSKFETDYPDIANDSDLRDFADRKTTAIAAEHPDWSPDKVMLEAGKQTREWVEKVSGKKFTPQPKPKAQGQQPSNRQQNKEGLRPMPQSRNARPAATEDDTGGSPMDYLADIRKSRGQSS